MTPGTLLAQAHSHRFRVVSYAELRAKATDLARDILKDYKDTPGGIIVAPILMGGGLPARLVIDALLPYGIVHGVVPCRIKRYRSIGVADTPLFDIKLPKSRVKDWAVLGIDDLVDGGQTMEAFYRHAKEQGAATVDAAVIFAKAHSMIMPKYVAESGVHEWLVMPGEEHDFMHEVSRSEPEVSKLTGPELAAYFLHLGIDTEIVTAWQGLAGSDTIATTDYAQTQRTIF